MFEDIGVDSPGRRATTAFALYLGLLHLRRAGSSVAPHGEELDDDVEHLCAWLADTAAPPAAADGTRRRGATTPVGRRR